VQKSIEKRLSEEVVPKTILGIMAKTVDPESGQELSQMELTTNSTILLFFFLFTGLTPRFAGVDTTSTGLTFTLYYLLANPGKWNRLCEEVRSRFTSEKEITNQSTSSLPYLDAVIHEGTSHLYPLVGFLKFLVRTSSSSSCTLVSSSSHTPRRNDNRRKIHPRKRTILPSYPNKDHCKHFILDHSPR